MHRGTPTEVASEPLTPKENNEENLIMEQAVKELYEVGNTSI